MSRAFKITLEIMGVMVALSVFALLLVKYYQPDTVRGYPEKIGKVVDMELAYRKHRTEASGLEISSRADGVTAESVPVLVYHGISATPRKNDITTATFKEQMFALRSAGYTTITLDEFLEFTVGRKSLPEKSVLITFDDGIESSYLLGDPVLRALDYNALVFMITRHSLRDDLAYYLSKPQVEEMLETGRWEIQPHARDAHDLQLIDGDGGLGHFFSDLLWLEDEGRKETEEEFRERISSELQGAKQELESAFNIRSRTFAFPFGDFGQSAKWPGAERIVLEEAAKYFPEGTFYQFWPASGYSHNYSDENSDKEQILYRRITPDKDWTGADLLSVLQSGAPKQLPFKDDFQRNLGWVTLYGGLSISNGKFLAWKEAEGKGFTVTLDGSYGWTDYQFDADLNLAGRETVSLLARYSRSKNYASCTFTSSGVRAQETVDGVNRTIASTKDVGLSDSSGNLSVKVEGNKMFCLVEGKQVLAAGPLDKSLSNGGIGLKEWDPKRANGSLHVRSVEVDLVPGASAAAEVTGVVRQSGIEQGNAIMGVQE